MKQPACKVETTGFIRDQFFLSYSSLATVKGQLTVLIKQRFNVVTVVVIPRWTVQRRSTVQRSILRDSDLLLELFVCQDATYRSDTTRNLVKYNTFAVKDISVRSVTYSQPNSMPPKLQSPVSL